VRSIAEVEAEARRMLGMTLITHQTGESGRTVRRLYIEDGSAIARELYFSALVDRSASRIAFIVSTAGGMDIEEVARTAPEKIFTLHADSDSGYSRLAVARIAQALELSGDLAEQCAALVKTLYDAFTVQDMSLLEINPLVVTKGGKLVCLDAKIAFDDNALYRHPDIAALRDPDEEDPAETAAAKHDLSYIKLDGTIGCMVNGAGLAMATMDIIKLFGAEPANFLDVGGGATTEKVTAAFKIILSDAHVKGVLVNIFGGIMKCDIIAAGIIAAAREVALAVPLVVRLEGTHVEKGKAILAESGLPIIAANDLEDAAKKIVAAVREAV
jgi:succinyl-CoA synthetase beta subunit